MAKFVLLVIALIAAVVDAAGSSHNDTERVDCFPADATVVLEGGAVVRMSQLRVGDSVLVSQGTYSAVFLFTHADARAQRNFVQLTTAGGETLELTAGHYLPVRSKGLVAAHMVAPGDALTLSSGVTSQVVRVATANKIGLYNPQTLHGNIAVNGIVASTFTMAADPGIAQALLSPVRAGYAKLACTIMWRHDVAAFMGRMLGTAGKAVVA